MVYITSNTSYVESHSFTWLYTGLLVDLTCLNWTGWCCLAGQSQSEDPWLIFCNTETGHVTWSAGQNNIYFGLKNFSRLCHLVHYLEVKWVCKLPGRYLFTDCFEFTSYWLILRHHEAAESTVQTTRAPNQTGGFWQTKIDVFRFLKMLKFFKDFGARPMNVRWVCME